MTDIYRKIANAILNNQDMLQQLEDMIATAAETAMKQEAAGDRFYIAQISREDIKKRNKLIVAQFNGRNIDDLAKTFNLQTRQIRNILKNSSK